MTSATDNSSGTAALYSSLKTWTATISTSGPCTLPV